MSLRDLHGRGVLFWKFLNKISRWAYFYLYKINRLKTTNLLLFSPSSREQTPCALMDTFPLLQYPDIHKTSSIPEIFIDGQIIYRVYLLAHPPVLLFPAVSPYPCSGLYWLTAVLGSCFHNKGGPLHRLQ